ncbi:hypothetical protein [Legionella tucsonensis]|uniref:Uncharacterized protein n=1 Tax=Legionella tucsonensis TaxID=40335 RepID=A0A0W0ZQL4_9GAMM|nr:hypothetical protein [Legionella tucsonensis]KTD71330.1 hypothetical protein Ltuc_2689 [Legionella tucsonensis]
MLRLRLARHVAEQYQEKGTVHLPDFLIYDFDENEYRRFWREIASCPRKRLYTDGINVFQVSWFRTLFESFKGWLGFENHCHPNRIEMTLGKIAYAGYLKGFKSSQLNKSRDGFPISTNFIYLSHLPRKNQTSNELQQLLVSYFITHSHAFPEFDESIRRNYSFGQSFIQEYLAYLLPSIDPQDSETINTAIRQINYYHQPVSKINCIKFSPFAEAYAQSLVSQQQFYEALEWSAEVKNKFKEPFIDFYLTQEENDPQALKNAVQLIGALFLSTNKDDQQKAVNYIKSNFSYEEQTGYLVSYPELRTQVAQSYLEDAKKEKSKWRITRLFTGNKTLEYLAQAVVLEPKILDQDNSMQDIMMRDEWTLYQFDLAMESHRFQDADILYTSSQSLKFNKHRLERLREYYFTQFDANTSQIKEALLYKKTKEAIQLAEEQIDLARKIVSIQPHDSLAREAILNYATTLLAIDELEHPVKESDRTQLSKAQLRLSEYLFLNNNTALMEIYNKLLLRKIDCLIAQLGVPIDYNDSLNTRVNFIKVHENEIEELKKELKTFITVNEPKSKEMRQILAKIYYLLADTLVYFEEKKQESIPYFKKAKELMPENLYYNLRYFEIIEDAKRHGIREKIGAIGHLHETQYRYYMDERWGEDKIMSHGFDIHAILPDDSFINTLSRAVGFL